MQHPSLGSVTGPMRTAAILLALALLLASCGAPRTPTPSASSEASAVQSADPSIAEPRDLHGQIAYAAGEDHQIFLLDLATGVVEQLTDLGPEHAELQGSGPFQLVISCGFGVSWMTWSPRGDRLAFSYGGCDTVLWLVDVEGELTRVGDGAVPAWSPDGTRLAFSPIQPFCMGVDCGEPPHPGAWNVQVVDIESGAAPAPLMVDDAFQGAGVAAWSPDGTLLAFSARPPAGGPPEVFHATYVMRDDGEVRHVADGTYPKGWLPDGRLLVVEDGTGVTHAIDLLDGTATPIGGSQMGSTTVSPDGTRVVVDVADPETGAVTSQLATIDGEVLVQRAGSHAAWSSDSAMVALLDLENAGGIVLVDRDGLELATYPLPDAFNVGWLAWRPGD